MHLTLLDWVIVALSLMVSFLPAALMARRAGASTTQFFTSGRARQSTLGFSTQQHPM